MIRSKRSVRFALKTAIPTHPGLLPETTLGVALFLFEPSSL